MASERKYGSEYEKAVLTQPHPAKTQFKPLEPPPYIAETGYPWLATRREELVVVFFLACVFIYCSSVYAGVYTAMSPFLAVGKQVFKFAWDAALVSVLTLKLAPLPRGTRKHARRLFMVVTVGIATARWYYPTLYPRWYPWQPE